MLMSWLNIWRLWIDMPLVDANVDTLVIGLEEGPNRMKGGSALKRPNYKNS